MEPAPPEGQSHLAQRQEVKTSERSEKGYPHTAPRGQASAGASPQDSRLPTKGQRKKEIPKFLEVRQECSWQRVSFSFSFLALPFFYCQDRQQNVFREVEGA